MSFTAERAYDDRENVNEWLRFGLKLGVQSLLHPFEYSKVLMQVRSEKNICLLFVKGVCAFPSTNIKIMTG